MKTFAAIDVGSYELSMKIFEVSRQNGLREIDCVRHRIDLGTDTFATGKISYAKVDELCRVLREYREIMESYHADAYKAYGTSAIRETDNTIIILDQIEQRTGIKIEVLSNSEQRFLDYKSIASKGKVFNKVIEKETAILDIGGGSIQISLFVKDSLVTTQNLRLGILRLQDNMGHLNLKPSQYENIIDEFISSQFAVFKKLYLKDRKIENIIVVDDYISAVVERKMAKVADDCIEASEMDMFMEKIRSKSVIEAAKILDMPEENIPLLYISSVLLNRAVKVMDARMIWVPGVTLCDGIAYEYGEKSKIIKANHDFEQDIIACAQNISKRYMGSKRRSETLEHIALTIFDSMKKVHGLGKRERLLLQLATILHDCGKYISLMNLGECSYNIIMSTEMIGLSHLEREIVANTVKYNHMDFDYYEVIGQTVHLDKEAYLKIAKLTAILKVANGLDRSHKQKFKDIKTTLQEEELIITIDTPVDITLEKGLFYRRAEFFEEVFSVTPVIKQKKGNIN
ncbi:MAG: HD domain-containing protein [Bacillus sp. (in: Bacteria)]|nr:HD domain-containing protein [Bacillus sp. (in: firmicutes)]MCM1427090.1 HD domain-containing protein [Eubacterium sp.]